LPLANQALRIPIAIFFVKLVLLSCFWAMFFWNYFFNGAMFWWNYLGDAFREENYI